MAVCLRCNHGLTAAAQFCPHCGTSVRAQSEPASAAGMLIDGRYALRSRLGAGGSGTVYLADHISLGKQVAIKAIHRDLLTDDLALERFRREATMVAALTNPHIVQVFDYGRLEDGRVYLAMEYLVGESLGAMIARLGRVSIDQALEVLRQACEALGEAHALGVVHRDLRPKNFFLAVRATESNFLKILDFGLAKAVDGNQTAATTTLGLTFGDPRYMSPEQAKGLALDQRSDLYQLGCVAYEMLTGAPPFHGAGVFEVLAKHASEQPVPIAVHRPDLSPALAALLMRLLEKSPEARFATAQQLSLALNNLRPGASASASALQPQAALSTSQAWFRAGESSAAAGSDAAGASQTSASLAALVAASRRRQRRIIAGSLLASAAAASCLVWWFVARDQAPRPNREAQIPAATAPPATSPQVVEAPTVTQPAAPLAAQPVAPDALLPATPPAAPHMTPSPPPHPPVATALDVAEELRRAETSLAAGAYEVAERRLRAVLAVAPDSAAAHTLLGEARLSRGAFAEAADAFKAALLITPDNARARRGYAAAESKLEAPSDDEAGAAENDEAQPPSTDASASATTPPTTPPVPTPLAVDANTAP